MHRIIMVYLPYNILYLPKLYLTDYGGPGKKDHT